MKKLITLMMIIICNFLITGCEGDNNNPGGDIEKPPIIDCEKTPEHESCQEDVPPVVDDSDKYKDYLTSLNEIVNVERGVIFEEYGDFTDELTKYLYYGEYPGREVTNEFLIEELEKITETNEFGYITFENLQFIKVVIQNTYESLDISPDGYESSTLYKIGTTHYFLVEPLLWRVLNHNPNSNELFLITENIIDAHVYVNETNDRFINGRTIFPSNYEYSDVRVWCNTTLMNQAFSEAERAKILLTNNDNTCKFYGKEDLKYTYDRNTDDYIFIPSYQEVTNPLYGFSSVGHFSYSRFCHPSNYASAKGVYTINIEEDLPSSGLYLLRSGNEFAKSFSYFVKFDGYALNPYYVNSPSTGVRVCININLD